MGGFWNTLLPWLFRTKQVSHPEVDWDDVGRVLLAFQEFHKITFNDADLLRQALTHRSFLGGESENLSASNERLEFLGDAVLELIVIDYIYRAYPNDREGELTQMKSLLVSKSVLSDCAEEMKLGHYILLSPAERESGGADRQSILADAFEAVLGALYLDGGIVNARNFVTRWLLTNTDKILKDTEKQNFKSLLQERVQARLRLHPRYRVVNEKGPDHHKQFTIQVVVRGQVMGIGQGHNKKEAEQKAAREALQSESLQGLLDEE